MEHDHQYNMFSADVSIDIIRFSVETNLVKVMTDLRCILTEVLDDALPPDTIFVVHRKLITLNARDSITRGYTYPFLQSIERHIDLSIRLWNCMAWRSKWKDQLRCALLFIDDYEYIPLVPNASS